MLTNKARIAIVLLFVTAMTSFGWAVARLYEIRPEAQEQAATAPGLIRTGAAIEEAPGGPFVLTDHRGKSVTDRDFGGRFLLVFFGYTFCPDVCPTTLHGVSQVLDLLGEEAEHVQALFISVDPERDTAEVLAEYVANFHPGIVGLTGTAEQVRVVAEAYGAGFEKIVSDEAGGEDDYLMNHSAAIDLMDREGHYLASFPYFAPPKQLALLIQDYINGKLP